MVIPKKLISMLLRLSISVILLLLLFKFNHIDAHRLSESIKNANRPILALAFFISLVSYVLCFYRWKMLLEAVNINLPFKRLIGSFCGGIFFSLFLPSAIGGDFARSIDLAKHTNRPREVVATVLLDRLSGYVGLAIIALFSAFLGRRLIKNESIVLISVAIIIAILIIILSVLFNNLLFSKVNKLLASPKRGRAREAIKNLHEELYIFKQHKKVILNNLLLSLLIQVISPLAFYVTALSLHIKKEIIYYFIFLPIIGAVTLLPISMGGFGVRENTAVIFFAKAGVDQTSAGAISLLNSFFILVYGLIGGLIYVLTVHHRRLQHNKPSPIHARP
jgi:uncharacterized protein (TIRG00374 family)